MSRLFACIISSDIDRGKTQLTAVAREFSHLIETLDDGIVFDVSGLDRLIGTPDVIAGKIMSSLRQHNLSGSISVAETFDSACLIARQNHGVDQKIHSPESFFTLPLSDLPIATDSLNVLNDLGIRTVKDALEIPKKDLTTRYGEDFRPVLDIINQTKTSTLTPNVKDRFVHWTYELDQPVQDFEQLIFVFNHGFEKLFFQISKYGLSTERLDIKLHLNNKNVKTYEISTAFPTLDRAFWLKLVNLRASLDPPEENIATVSVTAHFTKPRPAQRGLYAISAPEPESLFLTVNKLKKLVGEKEVGSPVLIDQRVPEPFTLDADSLPQNIERKQFFSKPRIAFVYYRPALNADVVYENKILTFVRTRLFEGKVCEYSGVWKTGSAWWNKPWELWEWDIEIENHGIYRLCRSGKRWLILGEYD